MFSLWLHGFSSLFPQSETCWLKWLQWSGDWPPRLSKRNVLKWIPVCSRRLNKLNFRIIRQSSGTFSDRCWQQRANAIAVAIPPKKRSWQPNMAELEKECTSTDDKETSCYPNPSDLAVPAQDENEENPSPQPSPDLKSVLVTSVLNLEKLDVDLYR